VWVDDAADAPRARELIAEYQSSSAAPGPPVKCPECGEENPSSFDLCWNCGRDLTASK
jgi:hypothetical protein